MRSARLASSDLSASTTGRLARLEPLLTMAEVAELLAISERTVKRLLQRGLPCVRFGRVVRFDQADVFRWIEARKE